MSYHNEHTHFCREMCNLVNTRFLRPYGIITEITTKSPQKLYNGSSFSPHFTQKSSFYPLKSFWPQVLKTRFHFWKHCLLVLKTGKLVYFQQDRWAIEYLGWAKCQERCVAEKRSQWDFREAFISSLMVELRAGACEALFSFMQEQWRWLQQVSLNSFKVLPFK